MNDYEKLKEQIDKIHKLMHAEKDKAENGNAKALCFGICNRLSDIYDFLNKLKELAKPEPKYKVGDKVWVRDYEFGPVETMICEVDPASKEMYYENEYQAWREEDELYPSKEALIESQIEYWSLKNCELDRHEYQDHTGQCTWCGKNDPFGSITDEGKKCEHVYSYGHDTANTPTSIRCLNCGEAKECEHEPYMTMPTLNDGGLITKCKKCGEFYR